jgi:hypothetical protein
MRQTIVISILILGLMTSYSLAQMGHGMMRDSNMMEKHGMKESGQMIEHGQMMENLKGITRDMSTMMGQLSGIINQEMSRERRYEISEMMRDVAAEMNRISFMLERGNVTEEEMKDLENRMIEIQKRMSDMMQ